MSGTTTVQVRREIKAKIDAMKLHHRESFNDVLERILEDLEDISPEAMRRYGEIMKEVKAGKFKTNEQAKREWGL
jgi:hypothetical protein